MNRLDRVKERNECLPVFINKIYVQKDIDWLIQMLRKCETYFQEHLEKYEDDLTVELLLKEIRGEK